MCILLRTEPAYDIVGSTLRHSQPQVIVVEIINPRESETITQPVYRPDAFLARPTEVKSWVQRITYLGPSFSEVGPQYLGSSLSLHWRMSSLWNLSNDLNRSWTAQHPLTLQ